MLADAKQSPILMMTNSYLLDRIITGAAAVEARYLPGGLLLYGQAVLPI